MMRPLPIRSFLAARSGASAIEFALVLPFMLLVMLGGNAISQAVMISRKVTITTRALADLTSQYAAVKPTDLSAVLAASQQVIAPFDSTPLSMRLSQVQTDALCTPLLCNATISWSQAVNMTAYVKAAPYTTLPSAMKLPNMSYVLSEVQYLYNPSPVFDAMGPYTLSDTILMLPRISNTITCTGC